MDVSTNVTSDQRAAELICPTCGGYAEPQDADGRIWWLCMTCRAAEIRDQRAADVAEVIGRVLYGRRRQGDAETLARELHAAHAREDALVAALLQCNWSVGGLPSCVTDGLDQKPLSYTDERSSAEKDIYVAAFNAAAAVESRTGESHD